MRSCFSHGRNTREAVTRCSQRTPKYVIPSPVACVQCRIRPAHPSSVDSHANSRRTGHIGRLPPSSFSNVWCTRGPYPADHMAMHPAARADRPRLRARCADRALPTFPQSGAPPRSSTTSPHTPDAGRRRARRWSSWGPFSLVTRTCRQFRAQGRTLHPRSRRVSGCRNHGALAAKAREPLVVSVTDHCRVREMSSVSEPAMVVYVGLGRGRPQASEARCNMCRVTMNQRRVR